MAPRTVVVVLSYCGESVLESCLESVIAQAPPPGGFTCVVVDNASNDDSVGLIQRRFPDIEILENERNLGFAGGNNRGIELAMTRGAEHVVLLNMDAIADPGWLTALVAAADQWPDAAILGSLVLTGDGTRVEFDGMQFDPVLTAGGYAERPFAAAESDVVSAAYACGAAMLVRTSALREIGLLAASFFLYHEDVELSLRAWRCGYQVLNVRSSRVRHDRSDEGKARRDFLGLRNLAATLFAHYGRDSWRANAPALLGFFLDESAPWRLEAAFAASHLVPELLRQRRRLRSRVVRSYSEVLDELHRAGVIADGARVNEAAPGPDEGSVG
jgi:hypothetical protein